MASKTPAGIVICLIAAALGCGAKKKAPPPEAYCPGTAHCRKGSDGTLKAGMAAIAITPTGYERPRPDFFRDKGAGCSTGSPLGSDGLAHCGKLTDDAFSDCGLDHLCNGDPGYPGPDLREGDGVADYFLDCGRDRICPSDPGYLAPDADGSEGDGAFQGFWLSGFGTSRPMYGVHDDIWARALVLESGDIRIALAAVDVVGLFYDEVEQVRARVRAIASDLDFDYIVVAATHSHESPDTTGQYGPADKRRGNVPFKRGVDDAWLVNVVVENTARAIVEAARSSRTARLYATQVHLGALAAELVHDERDPFVHDDTVTAVKLVDAATDQVIGTFASWGNHPETTSEPNNLVTSDFPAALRDGLEKGLKRGDGSVVAEGLGGISLFVNGSVGGMQSSLGGKPKNLDGAVIAANGIEKAKAVGEQVALVVLDALRSAPEHKSPKLAFGAQRLKVPVENTRIQVTYLALELFTRAVDFDKSRDITPDNMPRISTEIAKIHVGPLRFLAVPGELLPELAVGYDAKWAFGKPQISTDNADPPNLSKAPGPPYLKDQLGGEMPCVLGLANDELGYLIPTYDFKTHPDAPYLEEADGDHYEETNAVGASAVPLLLEAYKKLLAWQP